MEQIAKIEEESIKFAAIDIGSNAVRLLLARVFTNSGTPFFKKESLLRIPLRLGDDSFTDHCISPNKVENLLRTMNAFKLLIEAYHPVEFLACATSAMREARNGEEIVARIQNECDIDLEIVNGKREAEIIFSNRIAPNSKASNAFLYIDVGGGSTELTIFGNKNRHRSASFKIGTIRLLEGLVLESEWKDMKKWLKVNTADFKTIQGIGTGGNINKIFRLATRAEGKPLSYKKIKKIYNTLKSHTYEERIRVFKLRPDRADVVIPASEIYLSAMKWAKVSEIFVPQVGLADGLIHILYEKYQQNPSSEQQAKSN